jgi:PAS domain S-box-containing protein
VDILIKPTQNQKMTKEKNITGHEATINSLDKGFDGSRPFLFGIIALIGLYLTSLYNYLLFHSIAEIFSIIIACGIFMIAWNSRFLVDNAYLLFVGIAYLFIGSLDVLHALSYKGMGIFNGFDANLPTQLWISSRYMESASFFFASFFIHRKLKTNFIFLFYIFVTALLLCSIFYFRVFPTCFIEGEGLTWFKKISEYIISLILLTSAFLLFQKREAFDQGILRLLVVSIGFTIISELAFTFYINVYGISNLIGHYFKIISFFLVYSAIIKKGLTNPFNLMFRDLQRQQEELTVAYDKLNQTSKLVLHKKDERFRNFVKNSTEAIWCVEFEQPIAIDLPEDEQIDLMYKYAYVAEANDVWARNTGYEHGKELLGFRLDEIMPRSMPESIDALKEFVRGSYRVENWEAVEFTKKDVKRISLNNTVGMVEDGRLLRVWGTSRDITEQKMAEEALIMSKKDLQKLSGRLIRFRNPNVVAWPVKCMMI